MKSSENTRQGQAVRAGAIECLVIARIGLADGQCRVIKAPTLCDVARDTTAVIPQVCTKAPNLRVRLDQPAFPFLEQTA